MNGFIVLWIVACLLLLLALWSRRLESSHLASQRQKGRIARFGTRQFWGAFTGFIEQSNTITNRSKNFDNVVRRAEVKWLHSGIDLIAFTLLGSIVLAFLVGSAIGLVNENFLTGCTTAFVVFAFGIALFPLSVRAEEKKKIKILEKEVMENLPVLGSFYDAGAKGRIVLQAMIESLPPSTVFWRRLIEIQELMNTKGLDYLGAMRQVAFEWNSKKMGFLCDLIEKADRNNIPVNEEIKRVLEQNKESELLSAEAEAAGKEQAIMYAVVALLFAPGILFLLAIFMSVSNKFGF